MVYSLLQLAAHVYYNRPAQMGFLAQCAVGGAHVKIMPEGLSERTGQVDNIRRRIDATILRLNGSSGGSFIMAADDARETQEKFGKWLIENVRDYAVGESQRLFDEPPKDRKYPHWLYEQLCSQFDEQQRKLVLYLMPQIVDSTIHHLLSSLSETEWISIDVTLDDGTAMVLRGTGEGSKGVMFEWIRDYSKERIDYLDDADEFLPEI